MDKTNYYIIQSYNEMKSSIWNFLFKPQESTTLYQVSNPTIQNEDEGNISSESDRLSYIISMSSQYNDVFTPSSEDSIENQVTANKLTPKQALKLHIEGAIYDPSINEKAEKVKKTLNKKKIIYKVL